MCDSTRPEIRINYAIDLPYECKETVSGHVSLICNKTVQIKEIRIVCRGTGEIKLVSNGVQEYFKSEIYVNQSKILIQDHSPSGIFLSPGCTDFPFEFQLPDRIPSSFSWWTCNVKYSCTAVITTITKNNNSSVTHQVHKPFTVLGYYDISNVQNINEPASFIGEKNLTWLFGCCSIGKISTSFSINKKAYTIGDHILIAVNIVNKTFEHIKVFEARLMRMTTFKDQTGKRRLDLEPHTLCCVQNQCYQRPKSVGWARTTLRIPESIPPTNLGRGCNLFKVSYYLKLVISCSLEETAATSLRIFIPIKIGYTGRAPTSARWSLSQLSFNMDSFDGPPPYEEVVREGYIATLPSYDDIPPPAYDSPGFTC